MASTYSPLKIELIGTGEQAGTWGATTNTNLGTAIEEAITGSADVAFSSSDVTLTLTDTNATQVGRNLRLNLTGTSGGARNLILGSGMQIEKLYLINNGLADAVTVKNTTGTGIAVPAGGKTFVYNDGTNVVDAITLSAGTVTSVNVSGGTTGLTTSGGPITGSGTITLGGTLAIANGGTGSTSTTFVNLTTNVTDTLPVANGGTGITSFGTGVATFLGTPSSANLAAALTDETGSGLAVFNANPLFTTLRETATVTATAATGTINFDAITQSVLYYTANATANWTLNVRGNSGTTLNNTMATGQSLTIAFLVTIGATQYRQTGFQIDGSNVTPKWQGGSAPTTGNANSIDIYSVTIVKTGNATFTVFEAQTRFA